MQLSLRRQAGVTILEILVTLGILTSVLAGATMLSERYASDAAAAVSAQQIKTIGEAARSYIKDNAAAIATAATSTTPAMITVSALTASGYLPTGTSYSVNGQSLCVLVLEPTPNTLNALLVSEEGTPFDDLTLGSIAGMAGAAGGGIYSTDPTTLRGAMGNWSVPVGNFANANNLNLRCDGVTAGSVIFSAGHPVYALWFEDGSTAGPALYRNTVPGHPELNTMETPLIMAAVNTVNGTCSTLGAVSRESTGKLISCDGSNWKIQGSAYWEDPVDRFTDPDGGGALTGLPTCNASIAWQTRIVKVPTTGTGPRAYSCNGTSWQALAVNDTGALTVAGALTVGSTATITGALTANTLRPTLTAVEGASCAAYPSGTIAQSSTTAGLILSCQSSVWKRTGGGVDPTKQSLVDNGGMPSSLPGTILATNGVNYYSMLPTVATATAIQYRTGDVYFSFSYATGAIVSSSGHALNFIGISGNILTGAARNIYSIKGWD